MVGLVEHGDLDRVEVQVALLHEVFEAAGGGHDDVDAGAERGDLAGLVDAAEDRRDREVVGRRERLERLHDLRGELARRSEHEAERPARAALAAGERRAEACHHGQRERDGLARAGLAAAEHVASGERVGQRVDLDRERGGLAVGREGGDEGSGHAERAEGDVGHRVAFRGMQHRRVSGRAERQIGSPTVGIWRRRRSAHPFAV